MRKAKGFQLEKVGSLLKLRDGEIRTHGLFHPKEARYQAAPRPVSLVFSISGKLFLSNRRTASRCFVNLQARLFALRPDVCLASVERGEQIQQLMREVAHGCALVCGERGALRL
jgi:hypothetical protein